MEAQLFQVLSDALPKSYSPYSKFKVAAAILDDKDRIHAGVNIENAAYPEGWCAETSAIAHMVMAGGSAIKAIGVMGLGHVLCTPCGGCRQRIREFASQETPVLIFDDTGLRKSFKLAELLPENFGPDNLS